VVLLVRRANDAQPLPRPDTAERLLAERFAQGKINEDEYERRLRLLRSSKA
jgi:putative membrane protein